jgi:hypothetical protein
LECEAAVDVLRGFAGVSWFISFWNSWVFLFFFSFLPFWWGGDFWSFFLKISVIIFMGISSRRLVGTTTTKPPFHRYVSTLICFFLLAWPPSLGFIFLVLYWIPQSRRWKGIYLITKIRVSFHYCRLRKWLGRTDSFHAHAEKRKKSEGWKFPVLSCAASWLVYVCMYVYRCWLA